MRPRSRRLRLGQFEERTVPSSPGDTEWVRQFGSLTPGGQTVGRAVDAAGNVYVAGTTTGALPGQTSAGQGIEDAFITKFDSAGTELWTRQFGTPLPDQALGVAVDTTGVYVAGFTSGTLPDQTSAGGQDPFLRKYDHDGNELWTRQFGSPGDPNLVTEQATGVAADATGIYVAGFSSGTLPGQTTSGSFDVFIRKYDADGAEQWTRQFGSSGVDQGTAISADTSGVYVAGVTRGSLPGQSQNGILADGFVRKYDAAGNAQWTRQFGTNLDDILNGVAADAAGVTLVGVTQGEFPGQVKSGNFVDTDAFVRRYDAVGGHLWTRQFGTAFPDNAFGVAADASGVYVAGVTGAALPGQINPGGPGSGDAYVRKYDAAGTELWTRQFGTAASDRASGIAVDASGVYVVGFTGGTFPGQSGTGPVFLRRYDAGGTAVWTRQFGGSFFARNDAARGVDADGNVFVVGDALAPAYFDRQVFVRKFDAAGNLLWAHEFGTPGDDRGLAVAVDPSGVYVAGRVNGFFALPGQTPVGGDNDAFVRKYDADGNVLWTRQFGAPTAFVPNLGFVSPDDSAAGIAVDASGVYVAGGTTGAFSGFTNPGGFPRDDAYLRKYDVNGNVLWTRQFGTAGPDVANAVSVAGSGVYVAGTTNGTLPGQASAGGQDAFVRKYDGGGTEIWTGQFGTAASDVATGIAADSSGAYVSGSTAGTFPGQASAGDTDAFLRKLDPAGGELWTRQFGTTGPDQANGVAAGLTGAYVAGFVAGALPGETSAGGQDAFVRKYAVAGEPIWTGQFGTAATDAAAGVAVGAAGLFVTGFTTGVFAGQTSAGLDDAFVAMVVDTAPNTPPSGVSLQFNSTIAENGTVTLTGSFTDPDAGDPHTVLINWGPGEGTTTLDLAAGVTTFSTTHTYPDDNPAGTGSDVYPISATVSDVGASTSASADLTVANAAPAVTITGPASGSVIAVGTPITFTGMFTDPGLTDTHTAQWAFDAITVAGSVTQGSGDGTVSNSYTFTAPGVYSVRLTVTDDDGGAGTATTVAGLEALVVVYDPSAGFVTGGGWIDSPAGAYASDPGLTGRANFGFVAKYHQGANTPEGQTEFQFKASNLNFHSTAYDWLVVSGARAQFKGSGTINGTGNYGFKLTGTDGQLPGGGGQDRFRIKIWDKASGVTVYDNQMGAGDGAEPTTALGGGSIVIHSDHLLADEVGPHGQAGDQSLDADALGPLVTAARARWRAAGEDVSALGGVDIRVADLDGPALGLTAGGTVWLDRDAAGWGWFVDPTPRADSEFTTPGDQGERDRMDLLTVLLHELGHVLGHDHDEGGVMAETLPAGERRVPDHWLDADRAAIEPVKSRAPGESTASAAEALVSDLSGFDGTLLTLAPVTAERPPARDDEARVTGLWRGGTSPGPDHSAFDKTTDGRLTRSSGQDLLVTDSIAGIPDPTADLNHSEPVDF